LHKQSEAQEKSFSQVLFYLNRLARFYLFGETWSASSDDHMRDKFVSLEADKCQLVYLLARSIGAKNIVEAGTSFGVSTIYLALAVGQNVTDANRELAPGARPITGKVIATEKEPTKAARAKEHWKEAGDEIEPWIELREGDLLETLKVDEGTPETIDLLLLDSMQYFLSHPWYVGEIEIANAIIKSGRPWPCPLSRSFDLD
jgi:tRNA A58 N-methylase Trm61